MNTKRQFCRLVTYHELEKADIFTYFDVVQSIVAVKLVSGFTDNEEIVSIQVTEYTDLEGHYIYEIILNEEIDQDEGNEIAVELAEDFDFDFDFEISMDV